MFLMMLLCPGAVCSTTTRPKTTSTPSSHTAPGYGDLQNIHCRLDVFSSIIVWLVLLNVFIHFYSFYKSMCCVCSPSAVWFRSMDTTVLDRETSWATSWRSLPHCRMRSSSFIYLSNWPWSSVNTQTVLYCIWPPGALKAHSTFCASRTHISRHTP